MEELGTLIGLSARLHGTILQALHEAGLLSPQCARECGCDLIEIAQILDSHMPDNEEASPLAQSLHHIGRQLQG
jgi:hypothetical protein